jgi:hypothetical protein
MHNMLGFSKGRWDLPDYKLLFKERGLKRSKKENASYTSWDNPWGSELPRNFGPYAMPAPLFPLGGQAAFLFKPLIY